VIKRNNGEFVSAVPAVGWYAIFDHEDGQYVERVICWVVTSDGDVEGRMAAEDKDTSVCPQDVEGFVRYAQENPDGLSVERSSAWKVDEAGRFKGVF
jgi:hypothetical protein